MLATMPRQTLDAFAATLASWRSGTAEEVANIAFLLPNDAAYVTETSLPVDGGWLNTAEPTFKPTEGDSNEHQPTPHRPE